MTCFIYTFQVFNIVENTVGFYYLQIGFSGGVSISNCVAKTFVFLCDKLLGT